MDAAAAVTLVAVAFGAVAQAVSGLGFSIVCVPALTIAFGGGDGVRLTNLLAIGVNAVVLAREGRAASWRTALAVLVPATVVALVTAALVRGADTDALSVAAGVVVLAAVGVLATGWRAPGLTGAAGAAVAGGLSGAMNVVAGIGGPAVAGYTTNADLPPERLRPTLAVYFLGVNAVSVAARGVPGVDRRLLAASVVLLLVGYGVGVAVRSRIDERALRSATLVLAAVGAVAAIARGIG